MQPETFVMGIGDWQVPNGATQALARATPDVEILECDALGDYDPHYCTYREETGFSAFSGLMEVLTAE